MSQSCGQCGETCYRLRFMPTLKKSLGYGPGSCQCAERHLGQRSAIPQSTESKFKIRFDHVADSFGNHLEVSSIRQLEAAEKRLGFQSVVLNSDAQNFDDPPQQRPITVADVHNFKFSDRQRYERRFG